MGSRKLVKPWTSLSLKWYLLKKIYLRKCYYLLFKKDFL